MENLTLTYRQYISEFGYLIADTSAYSLVAFLVAGLAGLIIGLSPSTLPMVPVIVGYVVGGDRKERVRKGKLRGLILASSFVLGMATVDAAIGALFGILGYYVVMTITGYLGITNLLIAGLLIFLGLALLRVIRLPLTLTRPVFRRTESVPGAFLLGIPFGLSVCPACSPLVLPILGAAAASGKPLIAAALMFTFGLGRGVVVVAAGVAAGALDMAGGTARWIPAVEKGGGVLLVLSGLFFLYQSAMYGGFVPPLGLLFLDP